MAKSKADFIKEDLKNQLSMQGKFGSFYDDLINDYVYFYRLKNKLQKDINKKGLRYTTKNGNGIETEKPNESYTNLPKINQQMLKILNDFGLHEPSNEQPNADENVGGKDEDYLS